MKAKEKAIELVEKYYGITDVNFGIRQQKQCALITIDEIRKSISKVEWKSEDKIDFTPFFNYCEEVKEELLKL